MNYSKQYLNEAVEIIKQIDTDTIEKMVDILYDVRKNKGRIF